MSTFDEFIKEVIAGAKDIATKEVKGFVSQVQLDAQEFLKKTENDLKDWTQKLAKGQLSEDEFEDLVKGRKDLATFAALTAAGISLATIQRVRDKLINLVIDSAVKTFL